MKPFITGISTDVVKTIAYAIIVEALQADYWKPIQTGVVDFCRVLEHRFERLN
jgi:dethiobiotin synthetase